MSTHPYCVVHDQPLDWCRPPRGDMPAAPDAPRPELTGTCTASSSESGDVCGEPSAVLMTTGCEHEHLGTHELCAGCARYFAAASRDGLTACELCGSPRPVIRMAPLDAELAG